MHQKPHIKLKEKHGTQQKHVIAHNHGQQHKNTKKESMKKYTKESSKRVSKHACIQATMFNNNKRHQESMHKSHKQKLKEKNGTQ